MADLVKLPGFTPHMMGTLCVLAIMPTGVRASTVFFNTDTMPTVVQKSLNRLVSLDWVIRDEHKLYWATPEGKHLAQLWQLVQVGQIDMPLAAEPIPDIPAEPASVRVKAVRKELRLSQSQLADAIRDAGERLGRPNACTKRLVQKWESGEHTVIRTNYEQALALVTGREQFARIGRRMARPVNGASALLETPSPEGETSVGFWLGDPRELAELSDRVGQLSAELALLPAARLEDLKATALRLSAGLIYVRHELMRLSKTPVIAA